MESALTWQWVLVLGSSIALFFLAPWSRKVSDFFKATSETVKAPNTFLLTSSLVISWIFAKSITNAANLGYSYGMVGGVAYAGYYLSFVVAGIVLYQLRVKGGFTSIHHFLGDRYGKGAIAIFSLLIAFRLFNEVWSNTMVIGSYFGEPGSQPYYLSILVFTALTLAYVLKGGLRSSLLTDLIQMVVFGLLLVVILGWLLPRTPGGLATYTASGQWSMSGGIALLWVALVQSLSYPFHDPVMTDRAFITDPATTRRSFFWAGGLGFLFITLFSFVGIYGQQAGLAAPATVTVSQSLGLVMMLLMNFIMITSAASTLDSTFSSFSKLMVLDLKVAPTPRVSTGRWMMASLAILGTLPVFLNPTILSATTISGTMVIGLAPVFLFWRWQAPRWAFYAAICIGLGLGILLAINQIPTWLRWWEVPYGDLLSVNLVGTAACLAVFGVARITKP
ncbi:MAG TPA: sodium:solute symporter [Cytophagales bacterium]|nr:sodium:solute symporter [Cytophagales bacterium]